MFVKKTILSIVVTGIGLLAASGAAQAALVDRGSGFIYDTDLNVTWLADANYAITTGESIDGRMTWDQAMAWAANLSLSYYDGVQDVIYDDWRLPMKPELDPSCSNRDSYNCTGSEMGHLFYNELGGVAGSSILTSSDPDLALFQNIQNSHYWFSTGTEYTSTAWHFFFANGLQDTINKSLPRYAWAVRTGDVAPVPVPAAVWLFGSGLLGLAGVARRKVGRSK